MRERARSEKDRVFLHFEEKSLSYGELYRRVHSLAAGLIGLGFQPGDRAGICLFNCPEVIESFLAIIYAGGVAVPLNPQWRAPELSAMLANANARFLFFGMGQALEVGRMFKHPVETYIFVGEGSRTNCVSYESLIQDRGLPPQESGEDQLATLVHTSGTTGNPKAVMLTHKNFIANFTQTGRFLELKADDCLLGLVPLYHVMGIAFSLAPIFSGGSVVLSPEVIPTRPQAFMQKCRISALVSVPTAYALLNSLPAHPVAKVTELRFAISGGAPLPAEAREKFENRFHVPLLEGYGLSEATCVCTLNSLSGPRKSGSVGLPLPGVSMKVTGEDGGELPAGQVGEILISGDNVMAGYLGGGDATAKVLKDGWLHSGDMGCRDQDGHFYIKSRKKDLIIRGGENIYPREVEEVLFRHPAVAETAVVGVPDWVWGEEVVAFVVLKKGEVLSEEALGEYCHREIADYKCPRVWKVIPEMPKSATGEVSKKRLLEKYRLGW